MKYATIASRIGAPEEAWKSLGWRPVFCSEINPFCNEVLKIRHGIPNYGDMEKFKRWPTHERGTIDLICAGTPCQSFSVAGLRKGLDDPRGNLTLTFLAVLERYRPSWVVWENVPGILSDATDAFGEFMAGLWELGYGTAYRVLNAQFFGVPQRRRRVFVVGYFGDWRRAAAVLFDTTSLRWDSPPGGEERKDLAPTIGSRSSGGGGLGADAEIEGALIPQTAWALQERDAKGPDSDTKEGRLIPVLYENHGQDSRIREVEVSPQLNAKAGTGGNNLPLVAFHGSQDPDPSGDKTHPLGRNQGQECCVQNNMAVRRLTPRECERLQGFPDDYTLVKHKFKVPKDAPRYKALGNSMAVPVMLWLGKRIQMLESIKL